MDERINEKLFLISLFNINNDKKLIYNIKKQKIHDIIDLVISIIRKNNIRREYMQSFVRQNIINYKTIDKLFLILILLSGTLAFSIDQFLYVTFFLLGIMFIYRSIRDLYLNVSYIIIGLELVVGVFLAIYMAFNYLVV
nr:hypothetical protein [Bacillus mycoides]